MFLGANHWLNNEPSLRAKLPVEVWIIVFREIYQSTYKQLLKNLSFCSPTCDDNMQRDDTIFSYSCWKRHVEIGSYKTDLTLKERYYLAGRVNFMVKKLYAKDLSLTDALKITYQINLLKSLIHKTHVFHKKFIYSIRDQEIVLIEINTFYFWDEKRGKRFQQF